MADTVAKILLRAEGGAQVGAVLGGVSTGLKRLETIGAQVNRALGGMFAPLLAGASITGIVKGFSGIVNALDDMAKASQRVGVTVETLSALKYAADLSGVSFEQLQTGLAQFSKRLVDVGDGASAAANLLRQFGVTAGDDTRTALGKVAEAFSRAEDNASKTAAAYELFGRSGTELIPLLNAGADGLDQLTQEAERLGLVMETETAKAAEEFNDNLTRLKGAATGLAMDLSGPLVGALADLTNAMVIAAAEGSALYGVLRALSVEQAGLLSNRALSNLSYDIAQVQGEIQKLEEGGGLFGWVTSSGERQAALDQARQTLADLREQQQGLIKSEVALRAERGQSAETGQLVIKIEGDIAKGRGGGARAARASASAEEKLRSEVERTITRLEEQAQKLTLGERAFLAHELATKGATQAQIDYALGLYDQVEALEAAQKGAQDTGREVDILATVTERAAEGMTDALSDAFSNIFKDGVQSFKKLTETLKNLFFDLLGDLLAASLANPIRIVLGIGGTAAAGAASAATGAGGAGGALSFLSPTSLIAPLFNGMPAGILGTIGNMLSFGTAGLTSGTMAGFMAGATMLAPLALPLIGALALPKLLGDKTDPRLQVIATPGTRGFEDDVYARSDVLGISFGAGGKSHGVEASEYREVFEGMAALADAIGTFLGPDVAAQIAASVGRVTDEMKGVGLALDGWDVGRAFEHIFTSILDFGAETGDEMARILRGLVGEVGTDMEDAARRIASAIQYITGIKGFLDAPLEPTQILTLNEALGVSGDRVRELVAGFDGSVEAQQAILAAVQERYELEIAYLNQIRALSEEIAASFQQTYDDIRTAFFSPQQQYDESTARANEAAAQIPFATSPEELARLWGIVQEETARGWAILLQTNDELARENQSFFLTFLADTEAASQRRLDELEADMREDSAEIRTLLADQLAELARVGDALVQATNNMAAAAASIPDRIVVESRVNVSIPELG